MKSIRAALVILGIAGSVVMGSSAVAGAQSAFHRQAIRGTAHGVDAVTTNALCKQWHVVGHGTLNVHGNKDPYDLDACSYQVTNRDGSIAYHLSGDYTLREGSDVLAGHIEGTSSLTPHNTLRHAFGVLVAGGTGKFANARGTLTVSGTGTYDYTSGITITDNVKVNGHITLAS